MPSASPSIFSEFRINFQQSIAGVGRATLLLLEAFSALVSPPFRFKLFFKQMEFIGNKSLWITILTGTFTGMVLTIQSYFALKTFSSESIVGGMVAVSMTRELGPVLTALMVNARAGSAIAAELGTMRVTEQIDALQSLAVNPVQYSNTQNTSRFGDAAKSDDGSQFYGHTRLISCWSLITRSGFWNFSLLNRIICRAARYLG